MTDRGIDDYWTGRARPAAGETVAPAARIRAIDGVVPFEDEVGAPRVPTVPAALREVLFGQPDAFDPPMQTFAVLEAARVPGLAEMLETSELDHACLFQGAAAEDFRDVAPWIVRLDEDHVLTRRLFTRGDAPWNLWDREPGLIVRSRAGMDDVRRHLRKFTRLPDASGRWYHVRFWEGRLLADLAQGPATAFLAQLLREPVLEAVVAGEGYALRMQGPTTAPVAPPPMLDEVTLRVMARYARGHFLRGLRAECLARPGMTAERADAIIARLLAQDVRSREALRDLAAWWSTPEGWAAAVSDWGGAELAASRGMPDLLRVHRLRNLAAVRAGRS